MECQRNELLWPGSQMHENVDQAYACTHNSNKKRSHDKARAQTKASGWSVSRREMRVGGTNCVGTRKHGGATKAATTERSACIMIWVARTHTCRTLGSRHWVVWL